MAFSILLALSLKERHGYEIIKQIEDDSDGKIKLSPGALYASIKNLHDQGLITEIKRQDEPRRRYYRLTKSGAENVRDTVETCTPQARATSRMVAATTLPSAVA